jgi:hypothetical protein
MRGRIPKREKRENFRCNRKSAIVNPDAPLAHLAKMLHKQDFRDGL